MRQAGALLMLMGMAMALFAFVMDTSVTSSGTFIAGQYIGGGSTYNLGLLQQQMMVFQSGLAAFLAGAIFYGSATAAVEDAANSDRKIAARKHWTDIRDDKTEEERDERVERVHRTNRVVGGIIVVLIAAIFLVFYLGTSAESPDKYMNVDMNADLEENLATTNMNAS